MKSQPLIQQHPNGDVEHHDQALNVPGEYDQTSLQKLTAQRTQQLFAATAKAALTPKAPGEAYHPMPNFFTGQGGEK